MSLKQKFKTSIQFTKNILTTGAFTETSRAVELEICSHIPKDQDITAVEFGMGHGNITREILNHLSPNSKLYSFEVNSEFCKHVKETLKDDRLIIINDSAENIKAHVQPGIQIVVASIPFSFFSKEKGLNIIQHAYDLLANKGYYSQVLYTKFNFKKFQQIFENCQLIKLPNIPVEYIYHCQKEK